MRADYWISQEKKFCDFCKCWIAGNKPSVEFHEKGKRHIANVDKRIKEIGRKSQKDQKCKEYEERQIKMMEQKAMKSYMADVYLNADYSSQFTELPEDYAPDGVVAGPSAMPTVQTQADLQAEAKKKIKEQAETRKMQIQAERDAKEAAAKRAAEVPIYKAVVKLGPGATSTEVLGTEIKRSKNYRFQKKLPNWYEAKTDEDKVYYWNIITKASTYDEPSEGFVSMELQERNRQEEEDKKKKKEEQWQIMKNPLRTSLPESEKPTPFGQWTEVKESDHVDLQLPQTSRFQHELPVFEEEEIPDINFKQKVVKSIAPSAGARDEPVAFKKRKIQKFNVRQRNDDDDD